MSHKSIGADPWSRLIIRLLIKATLDHPPTDPSLKCSQTQHSQQPVSKLGREITSGCKNPQRDHKQVAQVHAHLPVQKFDSIDRLKPFQINVLVDCLELNAFFIFIELHIPFLIIRGVLFGVWLPIRHTQA